MIEADYQNTNKIYKLTCHMCYQEKLFSAHDIAYDLWNCKKCFVCFECYKLLLSAYRDNLFTYGCSTQERIIE